MFRFSIKIFLISIFSLAFLVFFIYFFVLPPKVVSTNPLNGSGEVSLDAVLTIKFNKPVKRQELKHFIYPEVHGEWRFERPLIQNHLFQTLVFVPAIKFEPARQYEVKIENIKGFGFGITSSFSFTFETAPFSQNTESAPLPSEEDKSSVLPSGNLKETEAGNGLKESIDEPEFNTEEEEVLEAPKVTLLDIPLDWQDRALSCEAASLKMALVWKGVYVSEDEIMEKIGYDLAPRKGNIWGDPYKAYVGDIGGKICQTGYGVYWEPVAEAANSWRKSEAFSAWSLEDLIREIESGNPVIIWGVLPVGTLNDCSWYTPEGKFVRAFKETHVRLLIGFIGEADNPLKVILNDPLAGRLYWDVPYFLTNWQVYGRSGVVVRE